MAAQQVIAAGGAEDRQLEAAHAALLRDNAIQFDLPPYVPPEPPSWLEPLIKFLQWMAPAVPYLFYIGLALVAALVIWWIARDLLGVAIRWPWQKSKVPEEAGEAWRPEAAAARHLLKEAEALAADGRYEEAVHLLLRRSVEDIAGRLPDFLMPSTTARDIAGAPGLPEQAREPFGAMAGITERALFARRPVGEEGWREARGAYERFAFSGSWQAA